MLPDGTKQPYYIEPTEPRSSFALAGLWDRSITPTGDEILSCTVITMPANETLRIIHNAKQRMPAILRKEDVEVWLTATPDEARAVLQQYPDELMHAYRVSARVNSPKNDGPELIQPAA